MRYKSSAVLLKAVPSRPDAARNSTVKRSERNKSHKNYVLTTCSVPQFCRVQDERENEKNNVTSRYAETYTTINCET